MKEEYEDFTNVEDLEDEELKAELLREGFKEIPLRSILAYSNPRIPGVLYRIDETKLPEKMKKIILRRVAEKNNKTVEEMEKILNKEGWFVRSKSATSRNVFKYI
jgi:hypothetical protein